MNKMAKSTHLSINTLNINGLNEPIKRHGIPKWIQKQESYICCLQETHFRSKDNTQTENEGIEKVFQGNGNKIKARVAILASDKIVLKQRLTKGK